MPDDTTTEIVNIIDGRWPYVAVAAFVAGIILAYAVALIVTRPEPLPDAPYEMT